jgi:hypothetical protein
VNILFIIPVIALNHLGVLRLMEFITLVGSVLFMIPAYFIQRRNLIKKNDPYQQLLIPGTTFELFNNRRSDYKLSQRWAAFNGLKLHTFLQKFNLW